MDEPTSMNGRTGESQIAAVQNDGCANVRNIFADVKEAGLDIDAHTGRLEGRFERGRKLQFGLGRNRDAVLVRDAEEALMRAHVEAGAMNLDSEVAVDGLTVTTGSEGFGRR